MVVSTRRYILVDTRLLGLDTSYGIVMGEGSASYTGRLTPWERVPCTYWIGGWMGPTAGMDDVKK